MRWRKPPTARAGIDAVRAHPPDLVLLDLNIPVVSGADVLEAFKADPATRGGARGGRDRDRRGGPCNAPSPRARTATSRSRSARSPCSGQWSGCFEVPRRRDRDGERSSEARLGLDRDPAPHRLRELTSDVEPEPGTLQCAAAEPVWWNRSKMMSNSPAGCLALGRGSRT